MSCTKSQTVKICTQSTLLVSSCKLSGMLVVGHASTAHTATHHGKGRQASGVMASAGSAAHPDLQTGLRHGVSSGRRFDHVQSWSGPSVSRISWSLLQSSPPAPRSKKGRVGGCPFLPRDGLQTKRTRAPTIMWLKGVSSCFFDSLHPL